MTTSRVKFGHIFFEDMVQLLQVSSTQKASHCMQILWLLNVRNFMIVMFYKYNGVQGSKLALVKINWSWIGFVPKTLRNCCSVLQTGSLDIYGCWRSKGTNLEKILRLVIGLVKNGLSWCYRKCNIKRNLKRWNSNKKKD